MQATAAETQGKGLAAEVKATAAPEPPSDQGLAADLYALIMHLHKNCNPDLLEALGTLELSLTQVKLLHHLEDAATELALKQGAEAVGVSLPAASRLVEDLVHRGLVERREDAEDRRMKRIRLTEHGRTVIARLNAARLIGVERFVATLSASERRSLAQLLGKLLAREDIAASRPNLEAAR